MSIAVRWVSPCAATTSDRSLDRHVRLSTELLNQVARHALLQGIATDDERNPARMIGEVQSGLAGRVSATDEVDVESMGSARFAACRAIVDTFADKPIEAVDREAAPRDASGKNDRPRPDDIVAIEVNLTRFRIEASDRARDQNFRPEPPCLLQCAARELVARDAAGEAEIVLDARGHAGLTSGRLALHHYSAQSFGRAVHCCCEAGRPAPDDHGVVFSETCLRLQAKELGKVARRGSTEERPVGQPQHRAIVVRRAGSGPPR